MDYLFNTQIQRNKDIKNAKTYKQLRKEKLGNVERIIYVKEFKKVSNNGRSSPVFEKKEYVRHNGKYIQLDNYKKLMNIKSSSRSSSKSSSRSSLVSGKECKTDCKKINKICNKTTGRCNKIKNVSLNNNKTCKKDCASINKICNKNTGRCNKY